MLGRKKSVKKGKESEEKTQIIETESVKPIGETIDIMSEEPTDVFAGSPLGDAFGGKFDARETIRRLARENPKMAARIIEQMIHEEAK
jgi:flagellar biosynthesis/type III secretory pathway M-ring protein FliF/YscJ